MIAQSFTPFVRLSRPILRNVSLSRDARFCYALLLDFAGQRSYCWPSLATLCELMGAGEDLVRRSLNELIDANLIKRERRGLNKTNRYHIITSGKPGTRAKRDQEADAKADNQDSREPDTEGKNSNIREELPLALPVAEPMPMPLMPARATEPDPDRDRVTALMGDIRHELRDRASIGSTVSRATNLYCQSGKSFDEFAQAVYSARTTTRGRQQRIRDRDVKGSARLAGYFFAVLADRLGLREVETMPENHLPAGRHQAQSERAYPLRFTPSGQHDHASNEDAPPAIWPPPRWLIEQIGTERLL